MYWIKGVGKKILSAKEIHVEDYANDITSELVPLDELGILIVCKMYHIHVGVVLNDCVWYTSLTEEPDECLFQCGVTYLDSCKGNLGYISPSHSVTVDITQLPQAELMALVSQNKGNENDNNEASQNLFHMTPLNLSQECGSSIDQQLDELNVELDLKANNKENKKTERRI